MVVVGEKNYKHIDEGPIRNVRRTRSPTANAEDSSASEEDDAVMRVGPDFQAVIPEYNPSAKLETKNEAMLVWAPHPDLSMDTKIDEYSNEAKEKHGYNTEQALGMLFWHKHNIEKSITDLPNFTPFPDEWSVEDRVLFEQAFSFHGKSFHRIRQMLPDKSIGCLVKYYYSWKKTRSRTSLIDRQANKMSNSRDVSDEDMEGSGSSESENETTKENAKDESKGGSIGRAGIGNRKLDSHARLRSKRKPPRGMYLNNECLLNVATGSAGHGDAIIKQYEAELVELKRQVQNNKQILSSQKEKTVEGLGLSRISDGTQKINGRWINEELLLAVQGVRKYGKDFKAISEVIGNKTESLVRSFFVNYRRRFNLDEVLAEYEKENGKQMETKEPTREENGMDVYGNVENRTNATPSLLLTPSFLPPTSSSSSLVPLDSSEPMIVDPPPSLNVHLLPSNVTSDVVSVLPLETRSPDLEDATNSVV